MGLFDRAQGFLEKLNTPNAETGDPSFLTKLGAFGQQLQGDDTGVKQVQAARVAGQTRLKKAQEVQMLDELAQRIGLSPRERLLMRVSPEKAAEVMAKALEPYSLTEGMGRYDPVNEENNRYNPRTFTAGDEILQTMDGGGINPVYTRAPSFEEETARIKAEQPISVGDGVDLIDPATFRPVYQNAKTFAPPKPSGQSGGDQGALNAIGAELRRRGLIK